MIKGLLTMLILGSVCGLILGIASKVFYVEPDHRAEEILALLPGYNCGGCGFPGCSGMAAAIAEGTGDVKSCKPSSQAQKDAVAAYLAEHPAA
ncbi:MAG: electron transporter RnfB [Solobacterium sp.]|nr:electron transporter RnfB [Erysipelotrichaceae bacterium]MBQ1325065.1 electron transporter RnfB [Solobacterium sp.]MBQ1383451.1 electron transporter RnfB [Solobacterium sp.]MBQ1446168.1 electron transporter RnfB [Solobacterium sp.]MBQ2690461.1 electron transporter RnfB [Solobacterium sp.]